MTKGLKIFMGIGCSLLVFGAVLLVGLVIGLNYLESRIGESTKAFEVEGREFGRKTDQQGCINEGLRRSKSMKIFDFESGVSNMSFVDSCLELSRPTPGFCAGVPSFWSMKDSEWKVSQCRKAGMDEQKTGCMHVFKIKHDYCRPAF
jgi:hypothetical protein